MAKTNDLFLPRTYVRRDAAERRQADGRVEPTDPMLPLWNEEEARAVLGRHLIALAEGGEINGWCWACSCPGPEHHTDRSWFCPAANGMICDTCCHHDMDDGTTGLRVWGDGPCIGCEHYSRQWFPGRPRRVERCASCDGRIAAGTWAYQVYRPERWTSVDTLGDAGLQDMPPKSDARWEWQHIECGYFRELPMPDSDQQSDA